MIELNGDNLISVLTLPTWNDDLIDLTEQLGLRRVDVPASVGNDSFYLEKYNLELSFGYLLKTEKQYSDASGDLYLSQIYFPEKCLIPLPFGLKYGETYLECIEKIKQVTNPLLRFRYEVIDDLIIENENCKYFFVIKYSEGKDRVLESIVIYPWNIKTDYSHNDESIMPLDVE